MQWDVALDTVDDGICLSVDAAAPPATPVAGEHLDTDQAWTLEPSLQLTHSTCMHASRASRESSR